jgi:hypothetical protein
MLPGDWFNFWITAINRMLATESPWASQVGLTMVGSAGVIVLAIVGYDLVLDPDDGRWAAKLVKAFAFVVTVYACTFYFERPMPALGMSLADVVSRSSEIMTAHFTEEGAQAIIDRSSGLWNNLQIPGSLLGIGAWINYAAIWILLLLLQAVAFLSLAVPLVIAATLRLLGPLFFWSLLVPGCSWMWNGWLRSFVAWSFFPVVASAVLRVAGSVVVPALDQLPGALSLGEQAQYVGALFILLCAVIYILVKLPSVVSGLFAGSVSAGSLASWRPWQ